jgi:Flp pilus assembly protein TadB
MPTVYHGSVSLCGRRRRSSREAARQIAKCLLCRVQKSAAISDDVHIARDISARIFRAEGEMMMAATHKDDHQGIFSNRAFVASVLWIVVLLGTYFVLTDWHAVPSLIASTVAAIH